jgi:hypothetical protein
MNTADRLREIAGQDTTPPLWIYVTKDQVPVLTSAAAELDSAADQRQQAFVAGVLFGAFCMQGRHAEAATVLASFRAAAK